MKSKVCHTPLLVAFASVIACSSLHTVVAAGGSGGLASSSAAPIYRFWSPVTGKHFYTMAEAEKDKLINQYSHIWTYEGIAYYAYAQASERGLAAVYRFWSDTLAGHFYTIRESERDKLINEYAHVWSYEGPAFYAYANGQQPASCDAIHRFWSDNLSGHFYTISEAEKDKIINNYSSVWTYEGIAWYALPPDSVAPDPQSSDLAWYSLGGESLVGAGERLTITRQYNVYAAAVGPDFTIQYRLSPNSTWGDEDDVILTPDESIATASDKTVGGHIGTVSVTVPGSASPGLYYLMANLDNGGAVGESEENNNAVMTVNQLTVTTLQSVDLGWWLNLVYGPSQVGAGGMLDITLYYSVHTAPVGPDFTIQCRLSSDTLWSDDDVVLTPDQTITLAADKTIGQHTRSFHVTVPRETQPGMYFLLANLDNDGTVNEFNETNNVESTTMRLTVTDPVVPDLSWHDLSFGPTSVARGGTLHITRSYYVFYQAVGTDFTIQYRLSLDQMWSDNDVILAPDETISTTDGKTMGRHTGRFDVTVPSTTAPGIYYLLALLDNGAMVAETSEKNNDRFTLGRLTVNQ